jgi:hypothetical protein
VTRKVVGVFVRFRYAASSVFLYSVEIEIWFELNKPCGLLVSLLYLILQCVGSNRQLQFPFVALQNFPVFQF